MSGIGFSELIILLMIGLIVLGPERLPRVASQLGSWLGQARRMTRVMRRQLEDEINFEQNFNIEPPARTRHSTPGQTEPGETPPPAQHADSSTGSGDEPVDAAPEPEDSADSAAVAQDTESGSDNNKNSSP